MRRFGRIALAVTALPLAFGLVRSSSTFAESQRPNIIALWAMTSAYGTSARTIAA